jgi:hypothetical protein
MKGSIPDPDLPIGNHGEHSLQINLIMSNVSTIFLNASEEKSSFVFSQELGVFREWHDDEETDNADTEGDNGFHDENPAMLISMYHSLG